MKPQHGNGVHQRRNMNILLLHHAPSDTISRRPHNCRQTLTSTHRNHAYGHDWKQQQSAGHDKVRRGDYRFQRMCPDAYLKSFEGETGPLFRNILPSEHPCTLAFPRITQQTRNAKETHTHKHRQTAAVYACCGAFATGVQCRSKIIKKGCARSRNAVTIINNGARNIHAWCACAKSTNKLPDFAQSKRTSVADTPLRLGNRHRH